MKKICLILLLFPLYTLSQTKKELNENIYYSSKKIQKLILKHNRINKNKNGLIGFRLQIAFASKKESILEKRLKFITKYPSIPIYLSYNAPYYKLRIGNFRNKLDALKTKEKIIENYPGTYIVTETIPLSEIND